MIGDELTPRIVTLMRDGTTWTANRLWERIPHANPHILRTLLPVLARTGVIVRVGPGRYQLAKDDHQ